LQLVTSIMINSPKVRITACAVVVCAGDSHFESEFHWKWQLLSIKRVKV